MNRRALRNIASLIIFSNSLILTRAFIPSDCGSELKGSILDDLFTRSYNRDILPPPGNNPIVVTSYIEFRNIPWVNENEHQFNVDLLLRQYWRDPRLEYKNAVSNCPSFQYITVTSPEGQAKLWKPNCFFRKGLEGFIHQVITPNEVTRIYPSGDVWRSTHARETIACSGKGSPSGVYRCQIAIHSYGYTTDEMVLQWAANPITFDDRSGIKLKDHTLGNVTTSTTNTGIPYSGTYSTLVVEIDFHRKKCHA